MNVSTILRATLVAAAAFVPVYGQPMLPTASWADGLSGAAPAATVSTPAAKQAPSVPSWEKGFDRWVDLKEFDFSLRYRSVFDFNNAHEFNQGQNRSILDGRFKFDEKGKYAIAFHGSTGHYFNWAYADFMGGGEKQALALDEAKASGLQHFLYGLSVRSAGTNLAHLQASGGWSFYLRRLYLDLEPVKGVEVQYGSLDVDRGVATEITTYDNDGYIDGERVRFKPSWTFAPDELSATYAYMGDLFKPNFIDRTQRLKQNDYHQFLARKAFAKKRIDSSFDYTWQNHAQTLHEALFVKVPEVRVIDDVRAETYQRLNTICYPNSPVCLTGESGFAVTLDKKFKRAALEGGYASIDEFSGVLTQLGIVGIFGMDTNGDQYGIGKRGFGRATIHLTPYLDATGFYTHLTSPIADTNLLVWNKQALNAGLVFDMKKAFFHETPLK